MKKFTEEELRRIIPVLDLLESRVTEYQYSIDNDTLEPEIKRNPALYKDLKEAVKRFKSITAKFRVNNPGGLSNEEWRMFMWLAEASADDLIKAGSSTSDDGITIRHTVKKVFYSKLQEEAFSQELPHIREMFEIIDGNDVRPFLERNSAYDYRNLYTSGRKKMLTGKMTELSIEEQRVLWEAGKYTIEYLSDCVKHGAGESINADFQGMLAYFKKYFSTFGPSLPTQVSPGGCYIATAVYGDYNCAEVIALRRFRDNQLLPKVWGRIIVHMYYRFSPSIAEQLKNMSVVSRIVRYFLNILIKWLAL